MIRYLSYKLCNIEPISIVDIYNSKADEAEIMNYLTGSSIRGLVMSRLAAAGKLENVKRFFFDGSIRFLDALPMLFRESQTATGMDFEKEETIPTPMGFYEGRQADGPVYHVFSKEMPVGMKRAKVGKFASIDDSNISFMAPLTGEQFKIRLARNERTGISTVRPADGQKDRGGQKATKIKKQAIFRGNYLEKGQLFKGYIIYEKSCPEEIIKLVEGVLRSQNLKLGSQRSSGFGGVRLYDEPVYVDGICPIDESWKADGSQKEVDLLCLSQLCMLNRYGEPCGLDLDELAQELGCSEVSVLSSSSSVTHTCNFNRLLGGRSAEYPVYEAGSIFRLSFSENVSSDKLRKLEDQGIGIRTTEGFGRVLFLKEIEKITKKQKCQPVFIDSEVFPYDIKDVSQNGNDVNKDLSQDGSDVNKGLPQDGSDVNKGLSRDGSDVNKGLPQDGNDDDKKLFFGIKESDYSEDIINLIRNDLADMRTQCAKAIWIKQIEDYKLTYILDHQWRQGTASKAQRGNIMILCKSLHYHPEKAVSEFQKYFDHVEEKERKSRVNASSRGSQKVLKDSVMQILEGDLSELINYTKEDLESKQIMGIPVKSFFNVKEEAKFRLGLLEEMIRFANRMEKQGK